MGFTIIVSGSTALKTLMVYAMPGIISLFGVVLSDRIGGACSQSIVYCSKI